MTYQYVNTGIDMDRNFTDIEGPDGMVSHAEVFTALNQRDIDAQAMRTQVNEIERQRNQILTLRTTILQLQRQVTDHGIPANVGADFPGESAPPVDTTETMEAPGPCIVTDAFLDHASREEWEYHYPEIRQVIRDLRDRNARQEGLVRSLQQQLHDALNREADRIDELTDVGKDLDRWSRVVDMLLEVQAHG